VFLGRTLHSIDEKNRLAIPARYRQQLANGVYITKGADRCLYLLTPDGWSKLSERIMALPSLQPEARRLQRHFFAGADYMVPDKLGRVIIPAHLREYAELNGEVVVAGVQTRIELWSKEAWDADEALANADTASAAAGYGATIDQSGSLGV
jgi:MraZ protein